MQSHDVLTTTCYRASFIFNLREGDPQNEKFPEIIEKVLEENEDCYLDLCKTDNDNIYEKPQFNKVPAFKDEPSFCDVIKIDDSTYGVFYEVEDVSLPNSIGYRDGSSYVESLNFENLFDADETIITSFLNEDDRPQVESIKYDISDTYFGSVYTRDEYGNIEECNNSKELTNINKDEYKDRSFYSITGENTESVVSIKDCKNFYKELIDKDKEFFGENYGEFEKKIMQYTLATYATKEPGLPQELALKGLVGAHLLEELPENRRKLMNIGTLNDIVSKIETDFAAIEFDKEKSQAIFDNVMAQLNINKTDLSDGTEDITTDDDGNIDITDD